MVSIYCIEDINNLNYIGSTIQKLNQRLGQHKTDKIRRPSVFSSSELNLNNCKIYELEKCEQSNRKERESYWINKMECVNKYKLNFDHKFYCQTYHYANRDKVNKRRSLSYHYKASWGGDKLRNNNLLEIDTDIFN